MNGRVRLASAAGIVAMLLATAAQAQEPTRPAETNWDYQVFCSSCHGAEGKGDGAFAKSMKKRPADLTQLARHNNGEYPSEKIFAIIEGGKPDRAHGNADMPAWGEVFAKSSDSAGAANAAGRIADLVRYLRTVQAK